MHDPMPFIQKEREQIAALKRLDVKKVKKFIDKRKLNINHLFVEEGRRPIHLVIPFRGSTELLEYLLEKDSIEVDALDAFGNTALMLAAAHGNLAACRILIQHGADYHLKSRLLKHNAIEIFEEKHGHLFSSFEDIIKEYEDNLKIEADNKTKMIEQNFAVSDSASASSLRQRNAAQMQTHCMQSFEPKKIPKQPETREDTKIGFWSVLQCFGSSSNKTIDASSNTRLESTSSSSSSSPKLN